MQIPFGEWLPDQPEHNKQGANVANNVYHTQNTYTKIYNTVDLGVVLTTKKGIKKHVYEKGKKYIVDWTKAKALGITTKH